MKRLQIPGILILMLAAISTTSAQGNQVIDKKVSIQFDEILKDMNMINIANLQEVKKVAVPPSREKVFDATLPALNAALESKKIEIENKKKEFVIVRSGKQQQIDKDLLPLLEGMPEPVTSLTEAKKIMNVRDEENRFNIYIEKLKRVQEQLKEEAARYAVNKQDADQLKKDAEKNAAKAMQHLNNNSLVQEAGGLEKLKQMTPAERQAWAKKMQEKVKNDPSAYTGQDGDPRKAFSNKMMKDPGYAARFQHMNQEQQQEEYKLFMAENGFVDNEAGKSGQIKTEHNQATVMIEITNRTTDILNHRKQLAEIAGAAQKRTDDYFTEVNNTLNKQYASRVEALPLVEHGEAGRSKDTYPVDLTYNTIVYSVETQNAVSNKEVWKRYLEVLKVTIAEYNEFMSEYWGRDKQTDQIMARQNQTPPLILAGACNELIQLTQMAKFMTNTNAGWQRTYDEKILHLYESIK